MTQIEIPSDGSRPLHGYLARPDGDGPWPGVVLIHEAYGLDAEMRKHADRLARAGYLTLAPANYGFPPRRLDETLAGACPVIASYGARDRMLRGAPAKLEAALARAGVVHDVKEYPNAGHAFLNEAESGPQWLRPLLRATHSGPEPESAKDGWRRIEAFFAEHLSAGRTP